MHQCTAVLFIICLGISIVEENIAMLYTSLENLSLLITVISLHQGQTFLALEWQFITQMEKQHKAYTSKFALCLFCNYM